MLPELPLELVLCIMHFSPADDLKSWRLVSRSLSTPARREMRRRKVRADELLKRVQGAMDYCGGVELEGCQCLQLYLRCKLLFAAVREIREARAEMVAGLVPVREQAWWLGDFAWMVPVYKKWMEDAREGMQVPDGHLDELTDDLERRLAEWTPNSDYTPHDVGMYVESKVHRLKGRLVSHHRWRKLEGLEGSKRRCAFCPPQTEDRTSSST